MDAYLRLGRMGMLKHFQKINSKGRNHALRKSKPRRWNASQMHPREVTLSAWLRKETLDTYPKCGIGCTSSTRGGEVILDA